MEGPKIVENLFFGVTCVSVFTCIVRSDYNFAMGLLCYYMIKNAGEKAGNELGKVARTVSQPNPPFSFNKQICTFPPYFTLFIYKNCTYSPYHQGYLFSKHPPEIKDPPK